MENYHIGTMLPKKNSLDLEENELTNLRHVLERKFQFNYCGKAIGLITKPKSENKWKFVIKKAVKFMKKKSISSKYVVLKGEKLQDERKFFDFYFESASHELNIPIFKFYLPNSKLRKMVDPHIELQTIKKSYIKLLCCSDLFRYDLLTFLRNHFIQNYQRERIHLFHKLTLGLLKGVDSRKFKVPWTDEELEVAKNSVLKIVNN